MNGWPLTTGRRLLLAFAISLLIHALLLLAPAVEAPPVALQLPPLTARIENVPKPIDRVQDQVGSADPDATQEESASSTEKETSLMPLAKSDVAADPVALPKHIQLIYAVYSGSDFLKSGEIRDYLDINQDRYVARSVKKKTGVSRLFNADQSALTSRGQIGPLGFQPDSLDSEDTLAGRKTKHQMLFDRAAGTLRQFDSGVAPLPADALDIVSFRFQLSQIPMHGELFTLPVSDGERLEEYQIEIGRVEELDTPMGTLHGLQLRQIHARHEAHFEIWLGREYRLLPVKFVRFDSSGNATESWVTTDIRASDD